jgi:hypothetical protein
VVAKRVEGDDHEGEEAEDAGAQQERAGFALGILARPWVPVEILSLSDTRSTSTSLWSGPASIR